MTYDEAVEILEGLFSAPEIKEEDEPLFLECFMFLATEEGRDLQGEAQFYLGEYYCGYELAEKYWLMYDNRFYEIESIDDKDGIIVRFGDKWFRSVEDFYLDAKIGSDSITSLAEDIDFIEVIT